MRKQKSLILIAIVGSIFGLTMILYALKGVAPFGKLSLAYDDAYYQYLDFLCYFKDVLSGENSIWYSFSNGLGKTNVGLFAYYLASPVNLIVLFFRKTQMTLCLNFIIAIKISLAGGAMGLYLMKRFGNKIHPLLLFLLSCSYAWMQYSWAQGNNIMWMDGVCLLPLMLLGVYELVEGKPLFLSAVVAVSIIVQWYTAGINCLFSAVWFVLELLLRRGDGKNGRKAYVRQSLSYLYHMVIGIGLSAVIFLPTILDLQGGKGQLSWDIIQNTFRGNVMSVIPQYVIGGKSSSTEVGLYCGSLAILGMILLFREEKISGTEKGAMFGLLVFSVLIYYWQPLFGLFSLLKSPNGHYHRFSYLTCFALIFSAAWYFCHSDIRESTKVWPVAAGFAGVLLLMDYLKPSGRTDLVYWTGILAIAVAISLKQFGIRQNAKRIISGICLLVLAAVELLWNGAVLIDAYNAGDRDLIDHYQYALDRKIENIRESDTSTYRISQTSGKELRHKHTNLAATYDNAMASNFAGIASYTSCPDALSLNFLQRAGYRTAAECATVVNTSILPVDSLLGVKYLLSPYEIQGYKLAGPADVDTEMSTWVNPYAFPMAFATTIHEEVMLDAPNPFEYVNNLYSVLYGEDLKVFRLVPHTSERVEGGIRYSVGEVTEKTALYGNIHWNYQSNINLNVNGVYTQAYAQWLTPTVFYIPVNGTEAAVTCAGEDVNALGDAQFYKVDFEVLSEVAQQAQSCAADIERFENGNLSINVKAEAGQSLFLSVPYHEGWNIQVNGNTVDVSKLGALMCIPLEEGNNRVEMRYTVVGLKKGGMISLAFLLGLVVEVWRRKILMKRSALK